MALEIGIVATKTLKLTLKSKSGILRITLFLFFD